MADEVRTVTNVKDFLEFVEEATMANKYAYYYRGHAENDWEIEPSLLRNVGWEANENRMIRGIMSVHPSEFQNFESTFDLLVKAQHHGLPTRLLDLTINPLIALYFACQPSKFDKDGEIIRFRVKQTDQKFFDSDSVSCVANLCHLNVSEKDSIRNRVGQALNSIKEETGTFDIELLEHYLSVTEFNEMEAVRRLVHFIRGEKSFFEARIKPVDLVRFRAVVPRFNNRRIVAQSGAFFVFGLPRKMTDVHLGNYGAGILVSRCKIPSSNKFSILRVLNMFAINQGSLFPELEKASEHLRRIYDHKFVEQTLIDEFGF